MGVFDIELVAEGDLVPSAELVEAIGDALDERLGNALVDPIISADLEARTIELSVEVHATTLEQARVLAALAFGAALVAAGATDEWTAEEAIPLRRTMLRQTVLA